MRPVLALVGRPNVGKSTLFNVLTRTRDALVADLPGLTRDRIYGDADINGHSVIVIDTAGIGVEDDYFFKLTAQQSERAMAEADLILFMVDARAGRTAADDDVAVRVRQSGKPVLLLVNKSEGLNADVAAAEFQRFGFADVIAISSSHGEGIRELKESVVSRFALNDLQSPASPEEGIHIAVVGRPNVGKSTLVNRILGEERVLVFDAPGTTRDSIYIPFQRGEQAYVLVDTAGVRRRQRVEDLIEKFSIAKTLQAIAAANVVLLVMDAQEGITDQDASLAGYIVESGRALVLVINKCDGLSADQKLKLERDLDLKLHFLNFAKIHLISARHGTGVGNLFESILRAYDSSIRDLSTPELTRLLESALITHQPPLVHGRRIKLRYAHQGGKSPPVVVIHGNQTREIPGAYRLYLENVFRRELNLEGTPLRMEFRTGENPFKGRKNPLTARQIQKRKRLKRHLKGK